MPDEPQEETTEEVSTPEAEPVSEEKAEVEKPAEVDVAALKQEHANEFEQNADAFFRTRQGQDFLANNYMSDYKKVEREAAETDEELSEEQVKIRALEATVEEMKEHIGGTSMEAKRALEVAASQRFESDYLEDLRTFLGEQPEARDPEIFKELKEEVMEGLAGDPQAAVKEGAALRGARDWWAKNVNRSSKIAKALKTSSRGKPKGGGTPEKDPKDMTDEEAKESVFRMAISG